MGIIKCTVCDTRYSDSKYNCPYCDYPTEQNLKEYRLQKVYDNEKGFYQEKKHGHKEYKVKSWSERLKNKEVVTNYGEHQKRQASQSRQTDSPSKDTGKTIGKSIIRIYVIIVAFIVLSTIIRNFIRMNPFFAYELEQLIDRILSLF